MSVQKSGSPESTKDSTTGADRSELNVKKAQRLESLLVDDNNLPPVEHLAGREVKVVDQMKRSLPRQLLITLLFSLVLTGFVLLVVNLLSSSTQKAQQENKISAQRLPIPKRVTPKKSVAENSQSDISSTIAQDQPATNQQGQNSLVVFPEPDKTSPAVLYSVRVGPLMGQEEIQRATAILSQLGLQYRKISGRGVVKMIRLREGIYPEAVAEKRLMDVRKISKEAFLLPQGVEKALYIGSFHEEVKALQFQQELAQKQLNVVPVAVDLTMDGPCLVALQADLQTAQQIAEHLKSYGWNIQLREAE